ncbi:MAG: hypothetical protein ACTIIH_12815 [Brevibacterium sp.]|uniref:hypothetical protein n=1 Tax=Brevibacterium TaxID=1696 RepID=UPI003F8AB6F0
MGDLDAQGMGFVFAGGVAQARADAVAEAEHGEEETEADDGDDESRDRQRDDRPVDDEADRYRHERFTDLPNRQGPCSTEQRTDAPTGGSAQNLRTGFRSLRHEGYPNKFGGGVAARLDS